MLLIAFFALFATCIALWSTGAPIWLVFLAATASWVVFTLVLYPKIRTYKAAMGFDDRLNDMESLGWDWLRLKLAGFKNMALAFLVSAVPFLGDAAQWLNGQNLDFALDPSKPERKQMVTFVIGLVLFAVPFLMSWLHSSTAAKAAAKIPAAAVPAEIVPAQTLPADTPNA